jgi:hypothetical protein
MYDSAMQPVSAVHRTIIVVDVEGFGDRRRTNAHQKTVRNGLYQVLIQAFERAGIRWHQCYHEDRGDGVFVLAPANQIKAPFVESLPLALVGALRAHNSSHVEPERIRLRMALHAGEITHDGHGVSGAAANFAFRLLEAPPLKSALAGSPGVLALIASSWFYEEVVRHSPASYPAGYGAVRVSVKETSTKAWICLPDHHYRVRRRRAVLVLLAGVFVVGVMIAATVASSIDENPDPPGAPPENSVSAGPAAPRPSAAATRDEPRANLPAMPPSVGSAPSTRPGPRTTDPPSHHPTHSSAPPPATSAPPRPTAEQPPVHVQRDVTLDRYSWLDLDGTAYSPTYGGDLYYGQDANSLEFFFQPMSESQIWRTTGSTQELRACQDPAPPQDKIPLDALSNGTVVCVRTTDGRLSGVKVIRPVEGPSGRSYELNYLTWERD